MGRRIALAGLCLVVVVLSGCSGAGTTVEGVKGGVPAAASRLLSTFVLATSWTEMLYPQVSEYRTYHERPVVIAGRPGTLLWGLLNDGGTYRHVVFADGSGSGTMTWGDTTLRQVYSAPVPSPGGTTTRWGTLIWSSGARLHWDLVSDSASLTMTYTGTATTPDGQKMTYQWRRQQEVADEVTANLPDGSVLQLRCPISSLAGDGLHNPVYAQGARGAYSAAAGDVSFVLKGAGARWDSWETTDSGGLSGAFSLDAGMAGSGTIGREGGGPAGLLHWSEAAAGSLDLVGAGQMQVTPSAAALTFQITSWAGSAALIGPAPLY